MRASFVGLRLLFIGCGLSLAGCVTVGTFDVGYEPVPLQWVEVPKERTALLVRPFADERPAKRKPSRGR